MPDYRSRIPQLAAVLGAGLMAASITAFGSSHREAPFITEQPKVDGTDFYMFRSYEGVGSDGSGGRSGFVTLIANYHPLQDAYGGPNYFTTDPNGLYEIHIDNDGDAEEELTFQFRFDTIFNNAAVPTGDDGQGNSTSNTIPLVNSQPDGIGPGADDLSGVNRRQTYQVTIQRDGRRSSSNPPAATNTGNAAGAGAGGTTFRKPIDNIGEKSINGNYADYAQNHVYGIDIPGCSANAGDGPGQGRVFVGQRQEGFVVNLGETFDLVNVAQPISSSGGGERSAEVNIVGDQNVTSIALELPVGCLIAGDESVIGGWTTASLRQARVLNPAPEGPTNGDQQTGPAVEGGPWTQVSRLGAPLVNEVVIGIDQKDRFNASEPENDGQFASFVTHPTLPVLLNALFETAVPETPRDDLVAAFLTGVPNLNQPANVTASEMLRLNTAITPEPPADQNDLGVLACDFAGFPNGRRPYDDVVDIELTVAEGALTSDNPNGLQFCDTSGESPTVRNEGSLVTDGARALGPTASTPNGSSTENGVTYLDAFPYLNTPLPGSPAN